MELWATKEAFFKCPVPKEEHFVEGIGKVMIHGLMCGEKDAYENDVVKVTTGSRKNSRKVRMLHARAVLLQRCIYNQHGQRLFGEDDIGRIEAKIPALVGDLIYDAARRLSGMLTDGIDEVEELVKNSETLQDSDSDTA